MSGRISGVFLACAVFLSACGGLSDVGNQDNDDAPPTASAVVLNQPFSTDAAGKVTTRVRSGSEVFLSGKDSDGTVAPVLKFDWQMLTQGATANQVRLVTRNKHTISFAAPAVPQDTTLQFRLTVTDSNGKTAQEDVDVLVIAIPDGNHFLSYDLTAPRKLRLSAMTSRDVPASELAAVSGRDVNFQITVRQLVDYTTPGVDGPYLQVSSRTLSGKWLASYGASRDCDDTPELRNPEFEVEVPAVNMDDILALVDPANPALEPNPALVDQFQVKLDISIQVTDGTLPADVQPLICAADVDPPSATATAISFKTSGGPPRQHAVETDPVSGRLELMLEQILGQPSATLDTAASARAYYAMIDPQQQRTSLLDWLKMNGFLAAARTGFAWSDIEASSTVHATYTNNFDLGFGRDMYARVGACSDGAAPQIGQPLDMARVGNCDIAAVVINYPSLEAATKKLNPVLAVAMEYTATAGSGGRRIVQFYTFAPDLNSGQFKRVLSANLDGRGEKFMPQVCTVCHGGTPGGLDGNGAYRNAGDVNATFLPWDLDAFLFADAEGASSDRSYSDQSQRSRYTRTAQAEPLRKLNQLAYLSYHDATRPNRFVLARQLLEGWYGTQAAPARAFVNTSFDSQYVPAGWTANGVDGVANTADDNPASSTTLYHNVFARYCRACHIAHEPSPSAGGTGLETLSDSGLAHNLCDANTPADEPAWTGAQSQLPFACYRQFVTARNLATRLNEGQMPFARLTMDRFWVGPSATAGSAGDDLYDHLTQTFAALPENERPVLTVPGTPSACFTGLADQVEVGLEYPLNASCSLYAHRYSWNVQGPTGSNASIAFADSPFAALRGVDVKGDYTVTLETASNVTQAVTLARLDRPIQLPVIAQQLLSPAAGQNTRDVVIAAAGGDGGLTLGSVASGNTGIVQAQLLDNQTVRLTGLNVSDTTVPITYAVTDGDGDVALGQFSAAVKAGLTANSFTSAAASVWPTGTAGVALPINLMAQVTSVAGQELEFFVSNPAGIVGSNGVRGTVSVGLNTGAVTYTPPSGTMSQFDIGGGTVVVLTGVGVAHDSFSYTVRYRDDPTTMATGTVTVPIQGSAASNVSFQSLYTDDLTNNCSSGCHTGAGAPAWFSTTPLTAAKETFCNLRTGADNVQVANSGNLYVNVANPSVSAMYLKPTGGLNHQLGGNINDPGVAVGNATLHQKILNWINEGAYFTNGANQDCP